MEEHTGKDRRVIIYTVLGIVIGVLLGTIGYLWQYREAGPMAEMTPTPESSAMPSSSISPEPSRIAGAFLEVKWEPKLIKEMGECKNPEGCYGERYLAGVIKEGKYKGQLLYLSAESGMGGMGFRFYIKEANGTEVFFDEEQTPVAGITDVPKEVMLPGTNYKLEKGYRSTLFADVKLVRRLFTHAELGDFYLTEDGCVIVELPDHTGMTYEIDIPFVNSENGGADITFTNGQKNKEAYRYDRIMGCGALCYYLATVDEHALDPKNRLVVVGKTSTNEDVYQINDSNDIALQELYNDENTVAYFSDNFERQPKSKYTYTQFIGYRPLLYWRDPLGRWIEFKNQRFLIAAEMCKPVIYLYPESKMNLTVKVNPNGGFTYTNPPYNGGWNVEAHPDGRVKDLATGQWYDYLFWEGIGMNYPVTDEGWVVKRENLEQFFDRMLPKLGMRGREIADFKDYWVNRLGEKPYYHLTFLKKTQFDEIAPLAINPVEPQSVIRVMMTAKGLDAFKKINPQALETPDERVGFTLVEWGGVVLK